MAKGTYCTNSLSTYYTHQALCWTCRLSYAWTDKVPVLMGSMGVDKSGSKPQN